MNASDPVKRIETLHVADIMIPLADYPKVTPSTPLRAAIAVMDGARLDFGGRKSLPRVLLIVDEDGCIKGHVRRRDVMHGLEPRFMQTTQPKYRKKWFDVGVDPHLSELDTEHVLKAMRQQAERPVNDIMRPIEGTLDVDDHIVTALYEMTAHGVPLIPVTREGKVVGIVRTVELFHELAQLVI